MNFSLLLFAQIDTGNNKYYRNNEELSQNCLLNNYTIAFHNVTHHPAFIGNFQKFILANIDFVKINNKEGNLFETRKDSALVKFVVRSNGELCEFSFFNNPRESIKQAIIQIFLQSPPWQPGTNDGGRMVNVCEHLLIVIESNRQTREVRVGLADIRKTTSH